MKVLQLFISAIIIDCHNVSVGFKSVKLTFLCMFRESNSSYYSLAFQNREKSKMDKTCVR